MRVCASLWSSIQVTDEPGHITRVTGVLPRIPPVTVPSCAPEQFYNVTPSKISKVIRLITMVN